MKKLLLINGGLRIGDTFHMIPYIYDHQDFEITWITGTYEQEAVKLIQNNYPNIVEVKTYEDGLPMNLADRSKFAQKVQLTEQEYKSYDLIESTITLSLDVNPTIYKQGINYLPNIKAEDSRPYICYQADSVSAWKHQDIINQYKLPFLKGYSIGRKGERIVEGTEDLTGLPLEVSARAIKNSLLFIGIHSAMSCLNLYLNHPGIVLHFTSGLLQFSKYNKKVLDILK